MTRRFLAVTVSLAATIAFLIGLVVAGTLTPAPAISATSMSAAALRLVATRPGDVLTMYLYKPDLNQRALETLKIDER